MRPTRSTAAGAVVAVIIALMAFHGPWWAQGSPPAEPPAQPASAQQAAAAAAPKAAPAAETPKADAAPAPAPAPVPAQPATPQAAPKAPADPGAQFAGANVTVYLRADAVGMQFTGANMEFRNLASRKGAFVRADDHWFVIKNESQEVWIPRDAIAMVEMR